MTTSTRHPLCVPIDENYFCDGQYNVLLSQSLGGRDIDPEQLAQWLTNGDRDAIVPLLRDGVCLPLFFDADCAFDGATSFVVGDLTPAQNQAWIARLTGKLAIPCGKLIVLCGGGIADELAQAISGEPADEDYCIYQTIEVPPGTYRVDVYAYVDSITVSQLHPDLDEDEIAERYEHLPEVEDAYVVHLTPMSGDIPLPALVDEVGWPGVFTLRDTAAG